MRIVIVGQTPPPYGGQAVAIEQLLKASYEGIELHHVRLSFSRDMNEIGRFRLRKLLHLATVVGRIVVVKVRTRASVLYYPPAGPDTAPMLRDLVILLATRWMFQFLVLHFHAGGISSLYPRLGRPMRLLFRKAYFNADVAIRISLRTPPDAELLRAKREAVVPYGLVDQSQAATNRLGVGRKGRTPTILFVGVLRESKGIGTLLDACALLRDKGCDFTLELMGEFSTHAYRDNHFMRLASLGLQGKVRHLGVLTGVQKWAAYSNARLLCFPTYFESESFGMVILEAMQFSLPVVATNWRGIPDMVRDGENGFLVPTQDPTALADRIRRLLSDPALAERLGRSGRALYEQTYTAQHFQRGMQSAFDLIRPLIVARKPDPRSRSAR
jgi:glycosyltransferase involved in cell wall biosynthesis